MVPLNNLVVVSDLHCGCRLGLCHPDGITVDDGGVYLPSGFQRKLWAMWEQFWGETVPEVTRGEPFGVVINGDSVDGVHHGSTTQVSHNLQDQARIAERILSPIRDAAEGRFWMVRGTEAHVGKSGVDEEALARTLGAIPDQDGKYARWELWKSIGPDKLIHCLHHIGTTGSTAYETTAVHRELTEAFIEAARWRRRPPDIICRSHRHRYVETTLTTGTEGGDTCRAIAVVTPGWQGRTPFAMKIPGARQATPQFGGIVFRYAHGQLFSVPRVWTISRSEAE
jgi:hypothetical protein